MSFAPLEAGATVEIHHPQSQAQFALGAALMPHRRAVGDGTKISVECRDGTGDQQWTIRDFTAATAPMEPTSSQTSSPQSTITCSFESVGVSGSRLGAGGWRKAGKASDVHIWTDTDVNTAKYWTVHRVRSVSQDVVAVVLESVMFPATFLSIDDQSKTLTLKKIEIETFSPVAATVDGSIIFHLFRIDPRPTQLLLNRVGLHNGNIGGEDEQGPSSSLAHSIFEIGLFPKAQRSAGSDDSESNFSGSTRERSVQQPPSPCQASGAWHNKSTCAALSTPKNMRIDIRYASRSDGAIVQLFERNCSAAQHYVFQRSEEEQEPSSRSSFNEVPRWDGTYSVVPRCGPQMVLSIVQEGTGQQHRDPTLVDSVNNHDEKASPSHLPSDIQVVKSCAPKSSARGVLIPSQRWYLLPRPHSESVGSCGSVSVGCIDIVSAESTLMNRVVLTIVDKLEDAGKMSINCCGSSLAARTFSQPEDGTMACLLDALPHCWNLQRSMMQELEEGQVVQLFSRLLPSLGVAVSLPKDDEWQNATAATEKQEEQKLCAVMSAVDPFSAHEVGGDSSTTADVDDVAKKELMFTSTCWRVGKVGQSISFTSLLHPTQRLSHIDPQESPTPSESEFPLVVLSSKTDNDSFLWRVFENQDGWCALHPVRPFLTIPEGGSVQQESMRVCLDVPRRTDDIKNLGCNVQTWQAHGGRNQQWKFRILSPEVLAAHHVNKRNKIVWITYHHLEKEAVDLLHAAEYTVVHFETTFEAWTYIDSRREQIACVVSSYMSKGIQSGYVSGLELCQRVRDLYKTMHQNEKQHNNLLERRSVIPLLAFVSTQVSALHALDVCDLFFSPSTGDTTMSISRQLVRKLAERKKNLSETAVEAPSFTPPPASTLQDPPGLSRGTSSPSAGGFTLTGNSIPSVSSVEASRDVTPLISDASNRFTIREKIGRGGFGVVYKAFDNLTGQYVVAKELIAENSADHATIAKEVRFLTSLSHPHIVAVKHVDAGVTEPDVSAHHKVHIYMEWMSGGSLADVVREAGHRLHESTIFRYVKHALLGLQYLHDKKVLHRDIKPGNLLLGNDVVKIADFGISTVLNQNASLATTKTMGTPIYLAPEALRGKFSPATDIWALGCTICAIASGQEPWHHLNLREALPIMFHIGTADPPNHHPLIPDQLSAALKDIVSRCFEHDPEKRPSATELLDDPYFQQGPRIEELERLDAFQVEVSSVCYSEIGAGTTGGGTEFSTSSFIPTSSTTASSQ